MARVEVADTYLRRLRGMLLRRRLPAALLLVPGGSVHGLGMTVALDVALLAPASGQGRRDVVGGHDVVRTAVLHPFGLVPARRGVRSVVEAPVGSFARWGLRAGSRVELRQPQA